MKNIDEMFKMIEYESDQSEYEKKMAKLQWIEPKKEHPKH